LKEASELELKGIMSFTGEPKVSNEIIGDPHHLW
jgi:glyceraldehyde-3-phosphate dehydrogenase/erythrose-4-phosphate dehydrogenase